MERGAQISIVALPIFTRPIRSSGTGPPYELYLERVAILQQIHRACIAKALGCL